MSHGMKLRALLLAFGACWGTSAVEPAPKRNLYSPYPQVTNIAEGIAWPKGQALPIFATPAATLDCIEVQALTAIACERILCCRARNCPTHVSWRQNSECKRASSRNG